MTRKVWAVVADNDCGTNVVMFGDERAAHIHLVNCMASYLSGGVCTDCNGTTVADDNKGRRPCPACDGAGRVEMDAEDIDYWERMQTGLAAGDYGTVCDVRSDMSDKSYFDIDTLYLEEQEVEFGAL